MEGFIGGVGIERVFSLWCRLALDGLMKRGVGEVYGLQCI